MPELALEVTGRQTLDNTGSLLTLDQLELTVAEPFKPWKSTKHQPRHLFDVLGPGLPETTGSNNTHQKLSHPIVPLVNHLAFQAFNLLKTAL